MHSPTKQSGGRRRFSRVMPLLLIGCLTAALSSRAEDKKEPVSLAVSRPLKLTGFGQFLYVGWDKGVDSFSARRVRLALAGPVLKNVNFRVMADLVRSPLLVDALVEFSFHKNIGLRAGQFQIPFSLESLASVADLDTINRSQPVEKFAPGRDNGSQGRDIGVAVFGGYSILEYAFGVFNGAGINRLDADSYKDYGGRAVVHPAGFLSVGGSFYKGRRSSGPASPPVPRDKTGLEFSAVYSGASLRGEYIHAEDGAISRSGWYLQAGCFFLPKKLQGIVKYDSLDRNLDASGDRTNILTLGVNWILSGRNRLQLNYEVHRLEGGKTDNSAILAQLQVAF